MAQKNDDKLDSNKEKALSATLAQLAATKVAALPQQVARGTRIAEGMQASGCAC